MPHKNIVSLEFLCETIANYYIGMEYCCYGDLFDAVTKNSDPTHPYFNLKGNNDMVKHVFSEIVSGVIYLHSKRVYHRDLKPENILIGRGGSVKIADFGLATSEFWSKEYGCGSSFYMSPELQDKHFSLHKQFHYYSDDGSPIYCPAFADVWSLGIILINLCFGRNPWKTATLDDPTFSEFVKNPRVLFYLFDLSTDGYNLIMSMLQLDPSKRISPSNLLTLLSSTDKIFYSASKTTSTSAAPYNNPNPSPPSATTTIHQKLHFENQKVSLNSPSTTNSPTTIINSPNPDSPPLHKPSDFQPSRRQNLQNQEFPLTPSTFNNTNTKNFISNSNLIKFNQIQIQNAARYGPRPNDGKFIPNKKPTIYDFQNNIPPKINEPYPYNYVHN
ncbi:Negative regulator of sexual conjugation and meiosis [Smittium mucronatum]|uniref:Negative regulator of sexual conjugation and meiosis n=1 Tax=Smittium mucronatum TaxID=133383 RepID=A0A1R0H2F4_9FUNG|nr:Negative regulator of sexual conjugation and meiosis [Smittium mucronatum]